MTEETEEGIEPEPPRPASEQQRDAATEPGREPHVPAPKKMEDEQALSELIDTTEIEREIRNEPGCAILPNPDPDASGDELDPLEAL